MYTSTHRRQYAAASEPVVPAESESTQQLGQLCEYTYALLIGIIIQVLG